MSEALHCDVVVVGGGIAGLWTHNRLLRAGYRSILLEAETLGGAQTLASHGIIHGSVVRVPTGPSTKTSHVVGSMPGRWAACLAGRGELDLSNVELATNDSYLWSNDRRLGEIGGQLASRLMRGRARQLPRQHFPDLLRSPAFRGVIYALHDLVLNIESLMACLTRLAGENTIYRMAVTHEQIAERSFPVPAGVLTPRAVVVTAGAGNNELSAVPMTNHPQHQVFIKWPEDADPGPLFGHCITGIRSAEPRLTVTTHVHQGRHVWNLGGLQTTAETERTPEQQIDRAIAELGIALPWVRVPRKGVEIRTINQAEGLVGGERVDEPVVVAQGATLTCWPTQLALAPALSDAVLNDLPLEPPAPGERLKALANLGLPSPSLGTAPWA